MGFTPQTILSDALAKQRIGLSNITLDSYTDTAIPSVTAGSWLDCAGTIYYLTGGDLTIDGDSALSSGPNSTTFYFCFDVVDKDIICTSSQPAWDDAKQSYYITLSSHLCRCLGSIYKNSVGAYELKTIWCNRSFGITSNGIVGIDSTVSIGALGKSVDYVDAASVASVVTEKSKIIEIGAWNMDATFTVSVAHGIADFTKIQKVSATIMDDTGTSYSSLPNSLGTGAAPTYAPAITWNSTNINLAREPSGYYDSATFNDAVMNRGSIEITYIN